MNDREAISEAGKSLTFHGGNINAARLIFPDAPEPWIDLSTGINPLPYGIDMIAPEAWSRLPEPAALAALETAARGAYGASASSQIVAAPGTQAILQWLPRLVPARHVGILGFTYGEHEKCWRAGGADVTIGASLAELEACDVIVVVNPNNPDGRMLSPDILARTARALAARNGLLVVDEAFMDLADPGMSLVPHLPPAGAVVLRSFGKTYGLAGIRLGFAIAPPPLAVKLCAALGPWAVCGPAIELGCRALVDEPWRAAALSRLSADVQRLDHLLQATGFTILGGTRLFRLVRSTAAQHWFERLCRSGILVRPFRSEPNWLRFGIPHHAPDWQRLEAALASRRKI